MPEALNKLIQPFMALPPAKRWVVGGVVGLSVVAFTILILVANRTDYRPLFTNLTSEDAGEIVTKLKEQKVPYRIAADGKAILVPSDKVYDLRLSLASDGLPQGGGVGFEIFDRKNFGMTDFVQKLNYQRALQGELSRTISQISGVEQARVHLVIPEKSLFKEDEKPATASVVLKVKGQRQLRENDVQGIVHLVASAIEGMNPEHVTVLDQKGKLLSKNTPGDATGKMTASMQEVQRAYERSTEERLQSLLDKAVGTGRSVARVSAVFDFRQVERYEEKYDPETVVRSEQRSEEKQDGSTVTGGVPGVQTNLGRAAGQPAGTAGGGSKNDETLNYEVSRATARTIEPVGTLSKVSVAILVDGKYDAAAAGKDGKEAKPKYSPRSPDELQKIDALVKSSVGFNAERGDQVTVVNIPFQDTGDAGAGEADQWWNAPVFLSLLKNGLIGFGFLALLFFVVRPLLKILRPEKSTTFEPIPTAEDALNQIAEIHRLQIGNQTVSQMELINKIKQEPYQAAQIIQNWLRDKGEE
ncbi:MULTISPECIES: flagellar basal-body MS-ring/collar protein FliF [Geobacter]|uniref:Flagellar M-ring protein n=2 Tax=Geobacter TaxID=28231 RepID=A0A0C1TXL7_9BACT|nr:MULTISPECIES: flagellar basal-body MS-ring/collar protein FliF [Geobacter]ANA39335.1 flagellar M-ring protein FliF [Geobacter anodireducens]KIE44078.1 flagellar M-ring protein FliF [Geobacter soli]MBE2886459.1 flagellar M-ring protein FliF [Geobacter anodireducens]HMN02484.1 flagellar basal-body MS-ring/collar protein FliF [Geobacter anodireducens]